MKRTLIKTGASVTTSYGGNGAADSGKVPAFGPAGEIQASQFLCGGLTTGAFVQENSISGLIAEIFVDNLSADRSFQWPNSSGTLATQEWASATFSGSAAYPGSSGIINAQTGTTYTLQSTDNGRVVILTNASSITLTVPTGLPVGFNCQIIQGGAGVVTVTASGTTLNSFGSLLSTAGQHASASIVSPAANTFVIAGNLQ